ncbi:MAG: hypothetical protein CME60_09275 [Halobacteriovoraceae bacterium]|nr:hypothetical protein [Halobacteriovoraceae bacterium]
MRTKNLVLFTLLSLLLASSCMPDSFTKFKEEEPKTSIETDGGSTEEEEEPEDVNDIVYTIDSIRIFQESGDIVFFEVPNADNFRVGDSVNVSDDIIGIGAINDVGTVQGIFDNSDGSDERYVLVINLDGTAVIGPSTYLASGKFIDNCVAGYGMCAAGSTGAAIVDSDVIFYIKSNTVPVGTYNFQKAITVTGTSSSGFSTANLEFDYSFSETVVGLGMNKNTTGVQTDDRMVSPFGPFLPNSSLAFIGDDDNPALTISVAVASGFYGNELNTEETGSVQFLGSTVIPGVELDSSDALAMSYPLRDSDSQRIALKVENISGFSVGESILSCRINDISQCTEASGFVVGKAQIEAINSELAVIYATVQGYNASTDNSNFPESNYIMNASTSTVQVDAVQTIFSTSDSGITLQPVWKNNGVVVAEPSNVSYSVSMGSPVSGVTFTSSNGYIAINNPDAMIGKQVTVTAVDTTTSETIGTFTQVLNALGSPSTIKVVADNIDYAANTGNPYVLKVAINDTDSVSLDANIPTDFPTASDSPDYGLSYIYYTFSAALPAGGVFTNSAAADKVATVAYSPSTYNNGATTYTVSGFHPALGGSVAFDTLDMEFLSATSFDSLYYSQVSGDKLILEVSDVTAFKVGDTISNSKNTRATINFINNDQKRLYVTMSMTPSKAVNQFLDGNGIDNTASYVISRATISEVIHVFDVSNTTLSKAPTFFDGLGNVVTLQPTESLTWAVTPNLPSDLNIDTDGNLAVVGTPSSLSVLSETEYVIQGTNELDENIQTEFKMAIVKSPTNASVARYQILKLSANANKFYRGTRISTEDDGDPETVDPSGRVLMKVGSDGLLVEGNGLFRDNIGVDNVPSFNANEGIVAPHAFLYVKDPTQLSVSDSVTGSNGATGTVVDKNNNSGVVYVKVNGGVFSAGETITGSGTTTIDNVETNHFITHIFQMSATGNFDIGERIEGSSADDVAIVVAVDNPYIFVRQVMATPSSNMGSFSQGDTITDANGTTRTLNAIVGPNIEITVRGGGAGALNSSGTATDNSEPFYEGQPITCYTSGSGYMASGFAVAGTDYQSSQKVVMQMEEFGSHCVVDGANDNFIDDISNTTVAGNSGGSDRNDIMGIGSSNLMIGYVGEDFYLDTFVQGETSSASLQPSTLPSGLTFNSTTGVISGKPTSPAALQTYTLTFFSSDGQQIQYEFDFVVYNQFEVSQVTDSSSSFLMHKEGRGYAASYCRVISPQVIDDIADNRYNQDIYGFNDVLCRLEGGEGDLYNNGIEFKITAGAGMCEFVSYTPFSYKKFLPGETSRTVVRYADFDDVGSCAGASTGTGTEEYSGTAISDGYVVVSGGLDSGQATAARSFGNDYCDGGDCVVNQETTDVCRYDYSQVDPEWPNIDTGEIDVVDVSCTYSEVDDGSGNISTECSCNYTETTVDCGGNADENVGGAKLSWSAGVGDTSLVYTAGNGIDRSEVVEAPITIDTNNKYLANYIAHNNYGTCYANNYHMEEYSSVSNLSTNRADWESYSMANDPLGSPGDDNPNSKFYTFRCLDAAYNPKATIKVLVRDWDNEFSPEDNEVEQLSNSNKMDSNTAGFDNIFDLDSFWMHTGLASLDPNYGTCGTTANTTSAVLGTITFSAGDNSATLGGGFSSDLPAGTVIQVGSDYFMIANNVSSSDTSLTLANIPSYGVTGQNFRIVRKISFPLR